MEIRSWTVRGTLTATALAAGLLLGTEARAQEPALDARWQAWVGCWQPSDAEAPDAPTVCVVPAARGVEVVTLREGQVQQREAIVADGARQPVERNGCSGWESAAWSADGQRLYRASEQSCEGGVQRRATGVMAISRSGEWLGVHGVAADAETGVRAIRYRPVAVDAALPAADAAALRRLVPSTEQARTAAVAPVTTADVLEASRQVDEEVLLAWLVETGQGFGMEVHADRLVELADAGVPERAIDLMVALSYPRVFAIDQASMEGERRPDEPGRTATRPRHVWDPWGYGGWGYGGWGYDGWGYGSGWGYSPYSRYGRYGGYGGYGWYGSGYPVVVVRQPSDGDGDSGSAGRGRAVNGRGYTRGGGSDSPSARPSSSSGRSGGSASSGASGSSGSSGGETRRGKPRSE